MEWFMSSIKAARNESMSSIDDSFYSGTYEDEAAIPIDLQQGLADSWDERLMLDTNVRQP
jgi:hypothetical protein